MKVPSSASKLGVNFKNENILVKISGFSYASKSHCLITAIISEKIIKLFSTNKGKPSDI